MTPGADVQAITVLEDWHTALTNFRTEGMESISMVALEIRRAFDWIDEQANSWRTEAREAEDDVVQAKAELNQRKTPDFSGRIPDTSVQEENLARAKARLEFARDQMDVCHSWSVKLPKMISEEYEGAARRLSNFLEIDVPVGLAHLAARINSLYEYTAIKPADVPPPPPMEPSS
jgi:hypothetical protein